jgi:RNA polymerase sigma-70 factor (ECF subfamily)
MVRHGERKEDRAPSGARRTRATDAAFRALYEARVADVARWIRALGGPPADREDVLQDVFAVAYRRWKASGGSGEAGWLYRITARKVRHLRRRLWLRRILGRGATSSRDRAAVSPSTVPLEIREKWELLERWLSRLKEAQRVSFVLFEIEGYTTEEIADMLGTSVYTVRSRILRTRKKLTELITKARAAEERRLRR